MSLRYLIHKRPAAIGEIADYLDALDPDHRRHEVQLLGRADQARLYQLADAAPPIELAHFVPVDRPARREVIHDGRNTLPLFRLFQKRFCRPVTGGERLFGYNEGVTRRLVGPGYFVARPTRGEAAWEPRGAVVIDYYQVPDGEVAPGWPPVVPNSRGAQLAVYHHTRDFMRRVSAHVAVGAAFRGEIPLRSYFVLCRRD
jgi:hypothetical protein